MSREELGDVGEDTEMLVHLVKDDANEDDNEEIDTKNDNDRDESEPFDGAEDRSENVY